MNVPNVAPGVKGEAALEQLGDVLAELKPTLAELYLELLTMDRQFDRESPVTPGYLWNQLASVADRCDEARQALAPFVPPAVAGV